MKKFLFLKIFFLALYSPTIFAITCSTGSGGGGDSSPATYTWKQETSSPGFTARRGHSSVVFDDDGNGEKMWVIGGNDGANRNDVYSSEDGKTWTEVRADGEAKGFSTGTEGFSTVVYDDAMWIIGGVGAAFKNSVYKSTNGKTWTEVRANGATGGFDSRYRHTSVVFDDDSNGEKMWVIGGFSPFIPGIYLNDVWSSTNGVTWTEVRENDGVGATEAFAIRNLHTSVVFNDGNSEKMWVIGGQGGNTYNDVWSSANGKDWTPVKTTTGSAFSIRQAHQSVVFDDKIWVIAGEIRISSNQSYKDDVWSSTNGISWVESTATVGFKARSQFGSVVFDNKIWVIGGTSADGSLNDVWSISKD